MYPGSFTTTVNAPTKKETAKNWLLLKPPGSSSPLGSMGQTGKSSLVVSLP